MKFTRKTLVFVAPYTREPDKLMIQYTGQALIKQYMKQFRPNNPVKFLSWIEMKRENGRIKVVAPWEKLYMPAFKHETDREFIP